MITETFAGIFRLFGLASGAESVQTTELVQRMDPHHHQNPGRLYFAVSGVSSGFNAQQ